jgi:hypothetical protein
MESEENSKEESIIPERPSLIRRPSKRRLIKQKGPERSKYNFTFFQQMVEGRQCDGQCNCLGTRKQ